MGIHLGIVHSIYCLTRRRISRSGVQGSSFAHGAYVLFRGLSIIYFYLYFVMSTTKRTSAVNYVFFSLPSYQFYFLSPSSMKGPTHSIDTLSTGASRGVYGVLGVHDGEICVHALSDSPNEGRAQLLIGSAYV